VRERGAERSGERVCVAAACTARAEGGSGGACACASRHAERLVGSRGQGARALERGARVAASCAALGDARQRRRREKEGRRKRKRKSKREENGKGKRKEKEREIERERE